MKKPKKTRRADLHVELLKTKKSDEQLVEEAIDWIREKVASTVFHGMAEVGEYILDRFFDGEPERVRSQASHKDSSFRLLVDRSESAELPLRRTWLHNAVSLAVMRRLLPKGATAFRMLPPSHQTTLLPLREPARVEQVAKQALSKRLSVRDLKGIVREEVAKIPPKEGEKRGRRPKPLIIKTLDRSLKIFTLESGRRSFTKVQIAELSDEETRRARRIAEELQESLAHLIERLQPR